MSMVNGMEFRTHEWRYVVFLPYGIEPPDLLHHFDGCRFGFLILNSLCFKKGGLVMSCYNELGVRVNDLSRKSLTPTHFCKDPIIHPGCTVRSSMSFLVNPNALNKPLGTAIKL